VQAFPPSLTSLRLRKLVANHIFVFVRAPVAFPGASPARKNPFFFIALIAFFSLLADIFNIFYDIRSTTGTVLFISYPCPRWLPCRWRKRPEKLKTRPALCSRFAGETPDESVPLPIVVAWNFPLSYNVRFFCSNRLLPPARRIGFSHWAGRAHNPPPHTYQVNDWEGCF